MRPARLRRKNGHWFSEAGGRGRYYGRADAVPRAEAMRQLHEALACPRGDVRGEADSGPGPAPPPRPAAAGAPRTGPSVSGLVDRYLAWLAAHRATPSQKGQRLHLRRFVARLGDRPARSIGPDDLAAWEADLAAEGRPPLYVRKHAVTVRTLFSRARKAGWLPRGFRPFEGAEHVRVEARPVGESDLPTPAEIAAFVAACPPDLADLVRCYHATGARTAELLRATVGDYQPRTRQLVLARHKRATTLRQPVPRAIPLDDRADAIVRRRCAGRAPDEPIWTHRGAAWKETTLSYGLRAARRRAGLARPITAYTFRHLWISEALMAGVDALVVARMAGTSVAMIARVYLHLQADSTHRALGLLGRYRAALRTHTE